MAADSTRTDHIAGRGRTGGRGDLNPVLVREVRRALRTAGAGALVVLVQFLLLGFVWVDLPGDAIDRSAGAGRTLAGMSLIVLGVVGWGILPLYGYRWLYGERIDRTAELIEMAPFGPGRAAFGRYQAGLVLLLLIASAVAPFLSFAYVVGGVDLPSLTGALALILLGSSAFFLAGVAWSHLPGNEIEFLCLGVLLLAGLVVSIGVGGTQALALLETMSGRGIDPYPLLVAVAVLVTVGLLLYRWHLVEVRLAHREPRLPVAIEGHWAVEVERLSKAYGPPHARLVALDRARFAFSPGEIAGLVGVNGAGKTTLLRVLATLERPEGGNAWYGIESLLADPERIRARTGYVPDRPGFYSAQSAVEYLDFVARIRGLVGAERRRTVADVLDFAGLVGLADRPVTGFSKGMKQRLSFAAALVHDPDVLLLDEPMEGIDPRARLEFRALLRVLADRGKAILVSSHILSELDDLIDRMIVLSKGRVVTEGSVAELREEFGIGAVLRLRLRGDQEAGAVERYFLERPDRARVWSSGSEVRVQFHDRSADGDRLVRDLYAAGVRVEELSPGAPDLETIFLASIGED